MTTFPVHDDLDVSEGETVFKSADWWKAVVLYEGYRGSEVGVYLWQNRDGNWRRKQKYVVRSEDDWEQDRAAIEKYVQRLGD